MWNLRCVKLALVHKSRRCWMSMQRPKRCQRTNAQTPGVVKTSSLMISSFISTRKVCPPPVPLGRLVVQTDARHQPSCGELYDGPGALAHNNSMALNRQNQYSTPYKRAKTSPSHEAVTRLSSTKQSRTILIPRQSARPSSIALPNGCERPVRSAGVKQASVAERLLSS